MNPPCEICSGDGTFEKLISWFDGEDVRDANIFLCSECNNIYHNINRSCNIWTWTQYTPFVGILQSRSQATGKNWQVVVRKMRKFFRRIHKEQSKKFDFVTLTVDAPLLCGRGADVSVVYTFISRRAARLLKRRWSAYIEGDARFSKYFISSGADYKRVVRLEFEHVSTDEKPILEKFIKPRYSNLCVAAFDAMFCQIFMDDV